MKPTFKPTLVGSARTKIADLAARSSYASNPKLSEQIKRIALDYGLTSSFTAFVAADSMRRTNGPKGTTFLVAVPVPGGR